MENMGIVEEYYKDNARKLRGIVDRIISKFGGIYDMDVQDFYSLANEVFVTAIRAFSGAGSFDAFLYVCLCNRIKTEVTRRNRLKRRGSGDSIPIDAPVSGGEDLTVADTIPSGFDVDWEAYGKDGVFDEAMVEYLGRLSASQRAVLRLVALGYSAGEVIGTLGIAPAEYADAMAAIRSYRNTRILLQGKKNHLPGDKGNPGASKLWKGRK